MHSSPFIFDRSPGRYGITVPGCHRSWRGLSPSSELTHRILGVLAFVLAVCPPLAAQTAGARHDAPVCVDVTVNDQYALTYECLNRQLTPAATASTLSAVGSADAIVRQPSNQQVGQFNFSAFSQRMGANLGKSAYPQRPAPTQQAPPFGGR